MSRTTLVMVLTVGTLPALGGMITFDSSTMPEDQGWERDGTFDADRWIDLGWFVQSMELGVWGPPPLGENDIYRYYLPDLSDSQHVFLEWRMFTNSPRSDVDHGPAVMSFTNAATGVWYHVSMTRDQARLYRDSTVPLLYFDMTPGVAHTFRLEHYTDQWYSFSIDGMIVDQGVPEAWVPSSDAVLLFGGQYYMHEVTNHWDYVAFSWVPEPGCGVLLAAGAMLAGWRRRR